MALNTDQPRKLQRLRDRGDFSEKNTSGIDTSFVVGDSPLTVDIVTDIGTYGIGGSFTNDGPGDIDVAISFDSTNFDLKFTTKTGETLSLSNLTMSKIKFTHVADSAYRYFIY